MLALNACSEIFLSSRPVDFRKQFDGLCGEVLDFMGRNPHDGSLFAFFNRRRDRMKLLWWQNDGFWIFYKRLEAGTFQMPGDSGGSAGIHLSSSQLQLILSGVELTSVRMRKRFPGLPDTSTQD